MYPHRFPFQLIDVRPCGKVVAHLTATAAASRGAPLSPLLGLEIIAQAALAMPPDDDATSSNVRAYLAGLDSVRFADELAEHPLAPGDLLEVQLRGEAAWGRLRKLHGKIYRRGELVIEAHLLLSLTDA